MRRIRSPHSTVPGPKSSPRRWPTPPSKAGFYTITDADGKPSELIEEVLAEIEAEAKLALDRIDQGVFPPTGEDRSVLALFIALQITRGRESRHFAEEVQDFAAKLLLQGLSREEARTRFHDNTGRYPSDHELDQIMEVIEDPDRFRIVPHPNELIQGMLRIADNHLRPVIEEKSWHLMEIPKRAFLTSDHPVVFWRTPREENRCIGVGLATADEIYFPLDPYRTLILLPQSDGLPERLPGTPQAAKIQNQLVAGYSYEWLFHHPKHDPLRKIVVSADRPLSYVNDTPVYYRGRGWDRLFAQERENMNSGASDNPE